MNYKLTFFERFGLNQQLRKNARLHYEIFPDLTTSVGIFGISRLAWAECT
jgi:hypothetical protein